MRSGEEDSQGPVIRDRRRIDPVTGQVRDAGRQAGPGQASPPQRGQAQAKPGRHAVSKPGGGAPAGGAAAGDPASGDSPAGGPPAAGGQGSGPAEGASNGPTAGAPGPGQAAEVYDLTARLAERTADLQRLQAEYANYRKRVERDRIAVREQALANVLTELLPVLDDIGRAREHGELTRGGKTGGEAPGAAPPETGVARAAERGAPPGPTQP